MSRRLFQTTHLLPRVASQSYRVGHHIAARSIRLNAATTLSRTAFSTSTSRPRGIMPETSNPQHEPQQPPQATMQPVELSDSEYNENANIWLDNALNKFEELQDQTDDIDVEYSAGVMTIGVPQKGTYVLNKQPPNKQIWLSSPISGPKRYDWCIIGDGQADKEGTAKGRWVYGRDQSTLDELILEELGVDLQAPTDA